MPLTRKKAKLIIWIIAITVYLLIIVAERTQRTNTGYKAAVLQGQVGGKENRNKFLRYQVEKLQSLSNIETKANEELKMSLPKPSKVIILEENI
ncbi:MAG: hypothetical protein HN833_02730 [Elusimicrobiaceae bacterium]|jgi:cell division protein FtsL|nr:hypothetical protein [Elusimicrobiaceae bacterium]MBT3954669.1 hypothetical protein [Elusimicrobiaceae bacterium]MBT4007857.1 hypothetical protein [Elusimicrobiaceae bacterium]MBT4402878.1 hypothetical protein [Elusimicrobiaceae bacterium]MBT4440112.1 hypothetical protein [Elusimicrobiaceae bacterium]